MLASPDEQEATHLRELSSAMQAAVTGTTALPMEADLNQVRDTVMPLIQSAEKPEKKATVARWIEELERLEGKAVAGLADTLLAVEAYRIMTLIADEGFAHKGWRCDSCGGLVADLMEQPPAECPYCGSTALTELPDIVGEMAVLVMASGGDVEIVHAAENHETVQHKGQVGGLLRY